MLQKFLQKCMFSLFVFIYDVYHHFIFKIWAFVKYKNRNVHILILISSESFVSDFCYWSRCVWWYKIMWKKVFVDIVIWPNVYGFYIFWYFSFKKHVYFQPKILSLISQHVQKMFDQDGIVPYPIVLEIWLPSVRTIKTSTNYSFQRQINEKKINTHVGALYWVLKCVTFMTISGLREMTKYYIITITICCFFLEYWIW